MAGGSLLIGRPQAAFLFQENDPTTPEFLKLTETGVNAGVKTESVFHGGVFVFQYWPTQIQDSYEVEWASKMIPGGSHPLYQYVGGSGRTISFDALFTSEVTDTGLPSILLPSARYTVDVAAAVASLRGLQYPTYGSGNNSGASKGLVTPPPRLRLCFPGTNIGADTDGVLCFLKTARVTYESCFPNGQPRSVMIQLEFIETVQNVAAEGTSSNIQFIDSSHFIAAANSYNYTSTT